MLLIPPNSYAKLLQTKDIVNIKALALNALIRKQRYYINLNLNPN